MFTLIVDRRGTSLDYDAQCVIVRHPELPPRSIPIAQVEKIVCMHGVELHTRLLGQCQKHGVDFIQLNQRYSENSFALHAPHLRNVFRKLAQFELCTDKELSLDVARRLIRLKLRAMCRVLSDQDNEHLIQFLRKQIRSIRSAEDQSSLRGIEGSAQRAMFNHWRSVLPSSLCFNSRQRRPPPDPVNALLSLSYTLAHHEAIRQCISHGLDPWLGFFHQPTYGRQSLACDLMELVRPEIELWIMEFFKSNQLDSRHFSKTSSGCMLGKIGRSIFYETWYEKQPEFSIRLSKFAALIARKLEKEAL